MAINDARSMNADLQMGLRDGKFYNLTPDRGGMVDMTNVEQRANELQKQYGVNTQDHDYNCGCSSCN